ncbi:MAG: TlpA disulfide reductase family protein [Burkholderiaceae bacterium]
MTQSLQIGPLALPYGVLLAIGAIAMGWAVGSRFGRVAGADAEPLLLRLLVVGIVAARLAYVWEWRAAYSAVPWSIFDIRDGGWDAVGGIAAAAFYGAYRTRVERRLRKAAVAAVLISGLVWTAGSLVILFGAPAAVLLPPLTLASLDGPEVALPAFVGKPTVINLWATWCPPCRREMPVLEQAQASNPDIRIVFANQGETADQIRRFLSQHGLALKNVLLDPKLQAGAAIGHKALPTTLFFDARGRLIDSRIGELSHGTLTQHLTELRADSKSAQPSPHID